ncbi:MAG: lambda exonuclease family protein [Nitrospiraceae bacterium]
MTMQIFDCEQGSPEWFRCRMGIPTSSEFKTLLSIKKEAKDKVTRQTYMRKLAGEILTGEPMESYSNGHMERGKEWEDEARDHYAFAYGAEPKRVGFVRCGDAGCSPDSLIGDAGGLEIKTAMPHIHIERLEKNELPPEHRAQVQGNLWITGRAWWDFVSYCPKLPLLVVRVPRDDAYIAALSGAVTEFNAELAALVERMRRYGMKEAA